MPSPVYSLPGHMKFMWETQNLPRSKRKQVMHPSNTRISLATFWIHSFYLIFCICQDGYIKSKCTCDSSQPLLSLLEHSAHNESMALWSPSVWNWSNWKSARLLYKVPAHSIEIQTITFVLLHLEEMTLSPPPVLVGYYLLTNGSFRRSKFELSYNCS